MNQAMQEELDLRNFARDNGLSFEPSEMEVIQYKPRGLTGKKWNQRKSRQKMAKQSRKQNRRGA